jgi:hypothetical protein
VSGRLSGFGRAVQEIAGGSGRIAPQGFPGTDAVICFKAS